MAEFRLSRFTRSFDELLRAHQKYAEKEIRTTMTTASPTQQQEKTKDSLSSSRCSSDNHHHQEDDDKLVERVVQLVRDFYRQHSEIKASHGWPHVARVYEHARRACADHRAGTVL